MPKAPPTHKPAHNARLNTATPGGLVFVTPAQESDKLRPTAAQRGYNGRWRRARLTHLAREPLCRECAKRGLVVAGFIVDHIEPHRGDPERFWNTSNWQTLCKLCHDTKTGRGL